MSAEVLMSPAPDRAANWTHDGVLNARAMLLLQTAIWALMFAVYLASPVLQMSDSQYSMLTAESILRNGTPDLSSYRIKNYREDLPFDTISGIHAYQLARTNGRLLYGFGHGTSMLSVPFVALMDMGGISPATPDHRYNLAGEIVAEKMLSALLMASLVLLFFRTAMLLLDWRWSVVIALGGGLGTSVWSTASRGMWAHTWEMMLAGIVVYLLLNASVRGVSVRPILLASTLSMMVFVRPNGALAAVAIAVYILLRHRDEMTSFAVASALWLGLFVGYSIRIFGSLVPYYYLSNDPHGMGVHFAQGLYGVLLSPSRGIFVYSPVFATVMYLAMRCRQAMRERPLAILALVMFGLISVASAAHPEWWGGNAYGPRLLSDAIPWLVLLAILALEATPVSIRTLRTPSIAIGAALLAVSIVLNAEGALSMETLNWNMVQRPLPDAMLDWSRPQFLASWVDKR